MKRLVCWAGIALVLCALPALSHHAAAGMTDEEVYEMIDALVADTPHASWTPYWITPSDGSMPVSTGPTLSRRMSIDSSSDRLGGGVTSMTISTKTARPLESMVDAGLLTFLGMLDGDVVVTMTFTRRGGAVLLIEQLEDAP